MPTKGEKEIITAIGFLLILIAFIAFFYEVGAKWFGMRITGNPYREYAMPVGILGVITVIVGLSLPTKTDPIVNTTLPLSPESTKLESSIQEKVFCIYCGAENLPVATFCSQCGKTITKQTEKGIKEIIEQTPPMKKIEHTEDITPPSILWKPFKSSKGTVKYRRYIIGLVIVVAIIISIYPTPHIYLREEIVANFDCSATLQDGASISQAWVDMRDLTKIVIDVGSNEGVNVAVMTGASYIYNQGGTAFAFTGTYLQASYLVSVTNPTMFGTGPSAGVWGSIKAYHIYNETVMLPWWIP